MEAPSGNSPAYANPMSRLAQTLGQLKYPVPASDRWIRVVLTLAPCSVLVVVSIAWSPSASFFLTFAGAFASIQLASPFRRWVTLVDDHLSEARRLRLPPLHWAKIRMNSHSSPMMYEGFSPVGYSPAAQARARRRFVRLARRWRRCFIDVSGRVVMPGDPTIFPAALPAWLYRAPSRYDLLSFVGRGATVPRRLLRFLIGIPWKLVVLAAEWVRGTRPVARAYERRSQRLLTTVGTELIRATADEHGDVPVRTLAKQLGLRYLPPAIEDHWAFRSWSEQPSVSGLGENTSDGIRASGSQPDSEENDGLS